ncbi:MAG: PH domain-containing protein [Planctomycetia bacterium]|nr:PH domain-containing protein [Planctomycetia bacterium]
MTLLLMFDAVWGLCWLGLVLVRNVIDFLQYRSTRLTITDRRTILRKGLFSKHISEVNHRAVRQVVLRQSFLQRLFKVGYIGISSSASPEMEIEITGVREPEKIKSLLNSLA